MPDEGSALRAIEDAWGGIEGDALSVTLYLDAKLALVDHMLLYFDKCSMAHSLEVRVPYLDHRLVEWAARVPSSMKVRRGVTKRVLKEAGGRFLPAESVNKSKVGFFRSALMPWLFAQLDGAPGERLRSPDARYAEFLEPSAVHEIAEEFRRHQSEDSARLVLAVMLLESWISTFGRDAIASAPRATD